MLAQQPGGEELSPDLVKKVGLVEPPQRGADGTPVQQLLRFAVIPELPVEPADGKTEDRKVRAAPRALQRIGQRVRQQIVIRVKEHDILRLLFELLERAVSRHGRAAVRHPKRGEPRILCREAGKDGRRAVGRAVVHDEQAQVPLRLVQDAPHRALDPGLGVVGGHDKGGACHGYLLSSPVSAAAAQTSWRKS